MNALLSEHLILRGEKMVLDSQPLGGFFKINGHPSGLGGHPRWRGYAATWEIQDGRLYLVAVDGGQYVGLDTLFPDYPDGVFAHWYTGELRCPGGKRLQIAHRLYSVLTVSGCRFPRKSGGKGSKRVTCKAVFAGARRASQYPACQPR